MFMSKPEHFLIIARPMRPVPIMAMVLPVTSRQGRAGMGATTALLFPHQALTLPHLARQYAEHEKAKLGGRFGEHVGVCEWDLVL